MTTNAASSQVFETLLGLLAADEDDARIQVVQVASPGTTPTLEMRLQRESADLGWVTQRRMRLAPGQVAALRDALNCMDRQALAPAAPSAQIVPFRRVG